MQGIQTAIGALLSKLKRRRLRLAGGNCEGQHPDSTQQVTPSRTGRILFHERIPGFLLGFDRRMMHRTREGFSSFRQFRNQLTRKYCSRSSRAVQVTSRKAFPET